MSINNKVKYGFLGVVGILIICSCSKTESSYVETEGFYVSYSVVGNNQNSATCTVTFQVGGPTGTYLDLSSGDSITCDGSSMARSEFLGIVSYTANVSYRPQGQYELIFNREGEGNYISTLTLPEPITGMVPSSSQTYQKANPISVLWNTSSNSEDGMRAYLNYSAGTTSYTFSKNDTSPESGSLGFSSTETQTQIPSSGTWTGSIKLSRYLSGSMASGLSGTIVGKQETSVSIQLID